MKTARYFAAFGLALAIGAGAFSAIESVGVRQMAPSVAYTLLDGTPSSTDALRGKVVLVNFWATSCVSCVHEMPRIAATHERFKARGFETLAVAMSYDPPAAVVGFAQSRQLPFGVVIDNTGAVARAFGDVRLTPTTLLINKRGEVVKRYLGEPDFVALERLVEALLVEG